MHLQEWDWMLICEMEKSKIGYIRRLNMLFMAVIFNCGSRDLDIGAEIS